MMETIYTVKYTANFKKGYKLAIKQNKNINLLRYVVTLLAKGEALPNKYHDHGLSGCLTGYRECHIMPDWLLIYRINNEKLILTLTHMGSHSDLFNK